jgi:hypothetical protein
MIIRDPQCRPSAELRSATLRGMTAEVFDALLLGLVNKTLAIDPPAGCPDALAKRLAKHNEAVADFLTRRAAWLERYVALPLKEAEPSAKPRPMIQEREAVLLEQVEVFADHGALLAPRKVLLGEVASVLREQEKAAADALEHERSKADKALRKMGHAPEDSPHFASNPSAVEIQFRHKVAAAAPVHAAQEALSRAHSLVEAMEAQIAGIAGDVALIEALRCAAIGEAVGSL